MPKPFSYQSKFLVLLVEKIENNLSDENYGVSELAESVHMSRSTLLRKVKQETGESVSVFIRNVRLDFAREMLTDDSKTISEIAFAVGFSSASYFTKCFRERFGYPPGEESQRNQDSEEIQFPPDSSPNDPRPFRKKQFLWMAGLVSMVLVSSLIWYVGNHSSSPPRTEKSIAILPFQNDSIDSSNVFFMNGMMDAISSNLLKVEEIRVTSRTSMERFRNTKLTIPELSEDLDVTYFLAGSGQKVGNEILLSIQLIKAPDDAPIWSGQYRRQLTDIFGLQAEVARSIAKEINAIIKPEESRRIDAIPTQNLVAYEYYLQGLALIKEETPGGLEKGISFFKRAISEDGNFAQAYAYIAISYYYLDLFRAEKEHTEDLKSYVDIAQKLDEEAGETLIAKALYFMQIEDVDRAIEAYNEVLDYYPNVGWVHNALSDIYATVFPNTEKYLEHALRGIQVAASEQDSNTASFTYLHLSNALAQNAFLEEAETYINKSLSYNPENLFSMYLKVYINLGQSFDLERTKSELIHVLEHDPNRLDIVQEIAKVCYTQENWEEAWKYYEILIRKKKEMRLDIYASEDVKIGWVLAQLGREEEAREYFQSYKTYAENESTIYHDLALSAYYIVVGDEETAISYLKKFSEVDNYQYWFILFLDRDPIIKTLESHPDFVPTLEKIRTQFWDKHKKIRVRLEREGVI